MMTVYGYLFLAADREHRVPVADQSSGLAAFAASLGLEVTEICVEEGDSLKKPFRDRPQGGMLFEHLQPGDVVVVLRSEWVLASAGSAVRLLAELRKRRVSLYCADLNENLTLPVERRLVVSEGNQELVRGLLEALAACESSSHGEAIKAAKRRSRRQGRYIGGPVPFGWQVDDKGFLRQRADQQRVIEAIKEMRGAGHSFREIAGRLGDEEGISLSHEGIRRILSADRARKEREQGGASVPAER
ncbi:recombinase family protein [Desulfofustis glycolicus]|nr:recombinase family protein [Desulfofustis glycolicus]MCB2218350.1 recombinase family protein [Desulfobulbaceae bacterium]